MHRTTAGTVAITSSVVAVARWLLSYSWLLGLVLPAETAAAVAVLSLASLISWAS